MAEIALYVPSLKPASTGFETYASLMRENEERRKNENSCVTACRRRRFCHCVCAAS